MSIRGFVRRIGGVNPKFVDAIVLLAFSLVITSLWFNNGNLAIGGDVATIPFHPSAMAQRYLSAWNFWIDGGNPISTSISNQVPPIDFLFYFALSAGNIPLSIAQGLYIVLFSYFLAAFGTYLLVTELFSSKIPLARLAALLAGLFAVLNPIYVYYSGYTFIVNSAIPRASLPVALFLAVAGFKRKSLKYAIALGLVTTLALAVFARPMEIGFLVLMCSALAIPYVPSTLRGRAVASLKFSSRFLLLTIITAIIVNLYWITSLLETYGVFSTKLQNYTSSHVAFESQFATVPNILRLMAYWPFYVGNYVPYVAYYNNPIVLALTFALPTVVLGGLLAWRNCKREIGGLGILLGIILFLCLGTNLPFGIFEAMIQSIPFFKLFQDPWVFLEPLAIVYSVLFGISVAVFTQSLGTRVNRSRLLKFGGTALALIILLAISWPVVSGSVFVNWYQPSQRGVSVPGEYSQLNSWLMHDGCDCATMIAPELSGSYVATSWGFQGPNVLYQNLFSTRLITGSGPAIYGLEPSSEKQLVNYAYTIISAGDPTYSPTQMNTTNDPQNWHFSVKSQFGADSIARSGISTPWNESTINWSFMPVSEGSQNGHSIYFAFNSTQDLSQNRWILIWASSTFGWSNLAFGVGDNLGNVSWSPFAEHQLIENQGWTLFGFPIQTPDVRSSDLARTRFFYLDYGLLSGQQVSASGAGTLTFGTILLSTGHTPEDFIEFLLGALNVKYIVLDRTIDGVLYPQLSPRPYESTFSSWTLISPVQTFGELTVYENPHPGSMIYAPANSISVGDLYSLPRDFARLGDHSDSWAFLTGSNGASGTEVYNATVQTVQQLGPTSFRIQMFSEGRYLLILSTAFDNNWRATSNGVLLSNHIIANGYSNGWIGTGSGQVSIDIQYQPQEIYEASLLLSIAAVLITCVIVAASRILPETRKILQTSKLTKSSTGPTERVFNQKFMDHTGN